MDIKKYFLTNKYTKMSEIIGNGEDQSNVNTANIVQTDNDTESNLIDRKPRLHNPVVGQNMDRLAIMCTEILNNLGERDSDKGPKIGELYQAIREGGSNFRLAEDTIHIGHVEPDIEQEGQCRKSEYYESILHLGSHFFSVKPSKLQQFDTLIYKLEYTIFSALGESECKGLGSGQYSVETSVQVLANCEDNMSRRNATWTDWKCPQQRYFNSKCQDIMSETSIKVEDLLTAMQLPRENSSLSNVDMVKLREYLHMGPTGCLVVRFMVLYLILIRMWHAQQDTIVISLEKKQVRTEPFTTAGISNCLNTTGDDTVINVVNMSRTEQLIMARSVTGYKLGDVDISGFDFYMGGFDVPSEVQPKGTIILLGADKELPLTAEVSQEDIYNTMVTYAMRMQSCSEMELGFNLAANLIFSEGLPNFSIPRPQGYVDIIATALSKVNTNGYVPPYHINELTMLGFMVLSRQQLLMVHDMVTYAESPEDDDFVPVLRVPTETRQALYAKYKTDRFSDAFSLSSIVDPLLILNERQVTSVRNVSFPTIAWSSINNDKLVKGTLSEYFWRGEWADPMDWEYLDSTTQRKAKTTFLANGFFIRPVTSGIRVRSWLGVDVVGRSLRMQPGKVSTRLTDIECAPKCQEQKNRQFKATPFTRQLFEDDEDQVTFKLDESIQLQQHHLSELYKNNVFYNYFGGGVGIYKRNDQHKKTPQSSPLGGDEKKDPKEKDKTNKQSKKINFETINLDEQNEGDKTKGDERKQLELYDANPTGANEEPNHFTIMSQMLNKYLNKRLCKQEKMLDRLKHAVTSISPEEVGLRCALRGELKLSGISKTGVRKWQLATSIMLPCLSKLVEEKEISIYRINKIMAYGFNVLNYGTARKTFNLKHLPSFDPKSTLFQSWVAFLQHEDISVTYKNKEISKIREVKRNKTGVDRILQELIELTVNLRFNHSLELLEYWNYELIDHPAIAPMTEEEKNEIKYTLSIYCTKCVA